jgi:transposase
MGDFSDLERRQIVGARLARACVTETATVLGVSKATVSKVMSTCTNHGNTSATRTSGRKSKLIERDRRILRGIVPKNHRTTAAQVTKNLILILKTLFPQELSDVGFTNPTSTVGLLLLNL